MRLPSGVFRTSVSGGFGPLAALANSSSPDVLLVPGFTGSKEDFLPLFPLLATRGYTAMALDQRGQHESEGPASADEYGLDQLGADVLAVAAQLSSPPHLVGHSLGGLVARQAALSQPDAIRSLVLLDSGPGPLVVQTQLRALVEALPQLSLAQIWAIKAGMEAELGVPAPPQDVALFLEQRWLSTSVHSLLGMAQVLLHAPDRTDELAALVSDLPTLVMFGEADVDTWPVEVQAQMARRLGVRHVVIREAAHSPVVENPIVSADHLAGFFLEVDGTRR